MKSIEVVAAVIQHRGRIFATQRGYGEFKDGWEFPGGKIEPNETPQQALRREIKEEFEMNIQAIRFLTNNVCEYPTKIIDLRLYECKYLSGEFNLHDHSEYKFVNKEDIINFDLCPADIPLAEYVKNIKTLRR